MPRTIDSLVASHKAAAERRARGLSPWALTIDIHSILGVLPRDADDEATAEAARAIGKLVRAKVPAAWLDVTSDDYDRELDEFVEEFTHMTVDAAGDDPEYPFKKHFDGWLDTFFDCADSLRIWTGLPRSRPLTAGTGMVP